MLVLTSDNMRQKCFTVISEDIVKIEIMSITIKSLFRKKVLPKVLCDRWQMYGN